MEFQLQSKSDVLTRLQIDLKEIDPQASTVEGTFNSDMLAANAIEFGKAYSEIGMMIEAVFADTSWSEYLTMRCKEFGVIRKTATAAIVNLTITGNEGSQIIANSLFATAEDLRFYTNEDAVIGKDGTVIVQATCKLTGKQGNVAAETIINIPYSIPGISSVNNIEAAHDGYDEESDKLLQERFFIKVRTPATSANVYHYENWALEVPGVGQVKVIPCWNGALTVKVIIIDDDNNTASDTLKTNVFNHIEEVRAIGADVTVTSPDPFAINISVIVKDGSSDETAVKDVINTYFQSDGFSLKEVSVAVIGQKLFDSGIKDYEYDSLKINGDNKDLTLTDEQLPICGTVTLNEPS